MKIKGITSRRAKNIAIDQSGKANSTLNVAKQVDLGITQNKWNHSMGGAHKRASHVAADGRRYDLDKGCPIPNEKGVIEYIYPHQKINCKCYGSIILPFDLNK